MQTAGSSSTGGSLSTPVDPAAAVVGADNVTAEQERGALEYLLGPTVPLVYDVTVKYETVVGILPLVVRFRQQDPMTLQQHDDDNRDKSGPFGKLDQIGFNAAVCAGAIMSMRDSTGRTVPLDSEEFRGGMPGGTQLALTTRFKFQGGLLEFVAEEIKRVSGYAADRVGTAQRVHVEAGKGS